MQIAYADALRGRGGHICPRRPITPPNRLDTTNAELLGALGSFLRGDPKERLRAALRERMRCTNVFFAPSCRGAIAQILSLLPQREVVMPAFTCPVVRTAAELAGKEVIYVDCARGSLNASAAEFEKEARPGRILVPTHLFGLPTDIAQVCALARDRGCVTLEDAAAAFGGSADGRPLGTFGDVGVVSFERSKRLPAFRGAAVLVNNDRLVDSSQLQSHRIAATATRLPVPDLLRALVYNTATVPLVYGWFTLHRLLKAYSSGPTAGETERADVALDTVYYRREFHPYQADLVLRALRRLDSTTEHIRRIVALYRRGFAGSDVQTFVGDACDEGALLRFPVMLPGRSRRDVLRRALLAGVYLETNYERPLPDPAVVGRYPNAARASDDLLLLPLYRRLPLTAAQRLVDQLLVISKELAPASAA